MQDTASSALVGTSSSLTSHCSNRSEKSMITGWKRLSASFITAVVFGRLIIGELMHLLSFVCQRQSMYSDLKRRS